MITFNEAWNSGSSTTEAIARQSISILKKELIEARHVKPEIYCIDGGWVDSASILGIDRSYFPHGFGPVVNDAEAAGMVLGVASASGLREIDVRRVNSRTLISSLASTQTEYCVVGWLERLVS
jgi:hypothetical protein